jgi:hypothetical protein
MSKPAQIVGEIKTRIKHDQPMIYWCERQSNGRLKQKQFYWGALPDKKLERLLYLINSHPPGSEYKIARMVGLNFGDVTKRHLQNSNFLKKHVLGDRAIHLATTPR